MAVPISNVTRRVVFSPSGTGPYAFTFEILAQTDIEVYKGDTLLTLTTDYSVTINANGTGSVTLVSTAGTDNITIIGARAIQRLSDFVTGGDFFANTVNDELDSLTIFAQQNSEAVSRALQAPETDPTTINMTLPRAATRANKTLAFDSSGNPVIGEIIGDNRGNWAASTSYNKRDIVKDTSNNNIYLANTAHTSSGSQPISTNADAAKWDLLVDAAAAAASATAAAASASAASTSESNASTSETNAASSASSASTSASNASTSATNASNSATAAASSASAASASASAASTSETNAAASESAAATSESNAASSASSASTSASNASTSATNAASSASAASTSASNASTSATNASNSATAAAGSATAAAASYDSFDDRYLGAKSSDPTTDNDGDPLVTGALYFNSTSGVMKVYDGSAWDAVVTTPAGSDTQIQYNSSGVFAGATITTDGSNLTIEAQGDLRLADSDSSNYVALQAPGTVATNVTLTLPDTAGSNGQALTTDGNGALSWSTVAGSPGGSDTQIQYNSGGSFAGASGLVTDGSNLTINAQGDLRFADSDSSNWVAFQAPATIASDVTWTLPSADGTSGQVLSTDGLGTLSWASGGGGGSSISAGDSSVAVTDTGSNGTATFTLDNTVRAKVNAYGIGLGTETPSSGMGIKFPVTQSASSDANTMDDYEEGTFTPTVVSSTNMTSATAVDGKYVKVGKLVYCEANFTGSITSSTAETSLVFALPFSRNGGQTVGAVSLLIGSGADRFGVGVVTDGGQTSARQTIYLAANQINASGTIGGWLRFSLTYTV